jgi:hypothetical protein
MDIINIVQSHGLVGTGFGFAAGLAAANVPLIIQTIVGSKLVTAAIRRNPKIAKEIVAELQKDVDDVADAPTAP